MRINAVRSLKNKGQKYTVFLPKDCVVYGSN
nr:MAG TPA: periostin [Caudoviricetes sp.]